MEAPALISKIEGEIELPPALNFLDFNPQNAKFSRACGAPALISKSAGGIERQNRQADFYKVISKARCLTVCAHVERRRSCIVGPPTWHMCHEDERFSGLTLAVFCALAARAQTSVVSRQCQAVRTPEVLLQTMKYFTLCTAVDSFFQV